MLRGVASLSLMESEPLDALSMAEGISQQSRREDALAAILNRWSKEDPAAVRQWAEKSNLTPAVRSRVTALRQGTR